MLSNIGFTNTGRCDDDAPNPILNSFTPRTSSPDGLVLPVISWTIGNLIVKNLPVKIPKNYTLDIPSSKKAFFEDGYKDFYKEKRKKKFKQGATLGTLILIGGVAASNTE